jgi:hypothetical protein
VYFFELNLKISGYDVEPFLFFYPTPLTKWKAVREYACYKTRSCVRCGQRALPRVCRDAAKRWWRGFCAVRRVCCVSLKGAAKVSFARQKQSVNVLPQVLRQ